MKVSEVMTKDVCVLDKNKSVQEAAKAMRDKNIGSLPVSEDDKLIGVITDRDLTKKILAEGKSYDTPLEECVERKIRYCYEDEDTNEISNQMSDLKIRRLPVMSRDKKLVGIVSLGDLAEERGSREDASEAHSSIVQ